MWSYAVTYSASTNHSLTNYILFEVLFPIWFVFKCHFKAERHYIDDNCYYYNQQRRALIRKEAVCKQRLAEQKIHKACFFYALVVRIAGLILCMCNNT